MTQPVRQLLIVGGGTAGWITAAFLNRFLDPARCRITLIESADIGTIGVGEATVPPLVALLRALGVDEDDFLARCNATYKLAIRFDGWRDGGAGDVAWHPFGPVGGAIAGLPLFHHWAKAVHEGREDLEGAPYAAHALQTMLAEQHKAPRAFGGTSAIIQQGAYAYHLDARLFAKYLAELATKRGVTHVIDDITGVDRAADGSNAGRITGIHTRAHGTLTADLYIDCTGFAALLSEKTLGDAWIDWSDTLLCDRALVLPTGADPEIAPYTRATALSAGWAWRIALHQRVGNGYVHSSRHIGEAEAKAEFLSHLVLPPGSVDPGVLRMRVGRRANFWQGNCVAIGLSAGFLEPIESTGIFLIQKGAEMLLDYFPGAACDSALSGAYNRDMGAVYEEMRDFILLHYLLNQRKEAFWQAARNVQIPESLAATLAFYDRTGQIDRPNPALFRHPSFWAIAAGLGRLPQAWHAMADYGDASKVGQAMREMRAQHQAQAAALPSQAAFIAALRAKYPSAQ